MTLNLCLSTVSVQVHLAMRQEFPRYFPLALYFLEMFVKECEYSCCEKMSSTARPANSLIDLNCLVVSFRHWST